MKEVHFWRANDGADFEDEDDCIIHELELRLEALGTDILCMTKGGKIYTEVEDLVDAELLYLGTDEAVNFWKDVNEYEGMSCCGCGCGQPGMYYFNDSGEWKNLEDDIQYLFQLRTTIFVKRD